MRRFAVVFACLIGLSAAAGTAQAASVYYVSRHPLPKRVGHGFCDIDVPHFHDYPPSDARLYRQVEGQYYFVGDPTPFGYEGPRYSFYGPHPIADVNVTFGAPTYCYLRGPHYHWYAPAAHGSVRDARGRLLVRRRLRPGVLRRAAPVRGHERGLHAPGLRAARHRRRHRAAGVPWRESSWGDPAGMGAGRPRAAGTRGGTKALAGTAAPNAASWASGSTTRSGATKSTGVGRGAPAGAAPSTIGAGTVAGPTGASMGADRLARAGMVGDRRPDLGSTAGDRSRGLASTAGDRSRGLVSTAAGDPSRTGSRGFMPGAVVQRRTAGAPPTAGPGFTAET